MLSKTSFRRSNHRMPLAMSGFLLLVFGPDEDPGQSDASERSREAEREYGALHECWFILGKSLLELTKIVPEGDMGIGRSHLEGSTGIVPVLGLVEIGRVSEGFAFTRGEVGSLFRSFGCGIGDLEAIRLPSGMLYPIEIEGGIDFQFRSE